MRLVVVLGDQLDRSDACLRRFDRERDHILMMEVREESVRVPSHRQRTALFLAAMRHYAADLSESGFRVRYVRLDDAENTQTLEGEVRRAVRDLAPSEIGWTEPGDWRVRRMLEEVASSERLDRVEWPDSHFLTTTHEFEAWAKGRKRLRMEDFYRWQRRRLGILVEEDGQPVGGRWNFDADNRKSFGTKGPPTSRPDIPRLRHDAATIETLEQVDEFFGEELPGRPNDLRWPVTRRQARRCLRSFVGQRLPDFGAYQDAMWTGESVLYHSLLAPALNLKLLTPRECVEAAVDAWRSGDAPIEAVEGFVRQIIGWREFVRGVYWLEGPEYGERNALDADRPLPSFYWTGETDYRCLADSIHSVLENAYGHHIQRLMVTGNFALLAGISPREVSDWYLGMFADGVDWVTTPNVVGMALHADARPGATDGVVGSKPYASTGRYIARMSNYCRECPYDPAERTGPSACPFTTLYWDFLLRHERRFRSNSRMALSLKNLDRIGAEERRQIRRRADEVRSSLDEGTAQKPH